jgi:hypothetical protein
VLNNESQQILLIQVFGVGGVLESQSKIWVIESSNGSLRDIALQRYW